MSAPLGSRKVSRTLHGIQLVILVTLNQAQAARFARTESRIVDGFNVTPVNKYPMIVALMDGGNFVCAGTILNKYYIMTTTNCAGLFEPVRPTDNIVAGIYSLGDPDPRYFQSIPMKSMTFHVRAGDPLKGYAANQIAVVRLRRPLVWNDHVAPTNLPVPDWSILPGDEILTTSVGWGYGRNTTYPYAPNRPLQEVTLPLLTTEDCQRRNYNQRFITDDLLCIAAIGGAGGCYEDQGGPAFMYKESDDKFIQIGIFAVSWDICGISDEPRPTVWTKVSKFIHWIDEATRECNSPRVI